MKLENRFDVDAPLQDVWEYLLDVDNVVPCMPGAELTETLDERNHRGRVVVKVGPVSLAFAGKVTIAEIDDAHHRIVLNASGMEQKGRGAAQATVTSALEPTDGGTSVHVVQDLRISGQAAQVSRGMMQDVSAKLTKEFADCLQANINARRAAGTGGAPHRVTAGPVKGVRLGVAAVAAAIKRLFARFFHRREH